MQAARGDEIAFIGMAGLDDEGPMEDFIDRFGLGAFPHAYDADGSIWAGFGTIGRSAFVFVNDDGTTLSTSYGAYDADDVNAEIDRLLAS